MELLFVLLAHLVVLLLGLGVVLDRRVTRQLRAGMVKDFADADAAVSVAWRQLRERGTAGAPTDDELLRRALDAECEVEAVTAQVSANCSCYEAGGRILAAWLEDARELTSALREGRTPWPNRSEDEARRLRIEHARRVLALIVADGNPEDRTSRLRGFFWKTVVEPDPDDDESDA